MPFGKKGGGGGEFLSKAEFFGGHSGGLFESLAKAVVAHAESPRHLRHGKGLLEIMGEPFPGGSHALSLRFVHVGFERAAFDEGEEIPHVCKQGNERSGPAYGGADAVHRLVRGLVETEGVVVSVRQQIGFVESGGKGRRENEVKLAPKPVGIGKHLVVEAWSAADQIARGKAQAISPGVHKSTGTFQKVQKSEIRKTSLCGQPLGKRRWKAKSTRSDVVLKAFSIWETMALLVNNLGSLQFGHVPILTY